jgi:hypothetical protein
MVRQHYLQPRQQCLRGYQIATIVRQFSDDLSLYCNSKRSKAAGTGAAFGFKFLWRALQAKLCWRPPQPKK